MIECGQPGMCRSSALNGCIDRNSGAGECVTGIRVKDTEPLVWRTMLQKGNINDQSLDREFSVG